MNNLIGIVEDINDPLKIGRVRVRVSGIHTDDINKIPTESLPWAKTLLPTTASNSTGVGNYKHNIQVGAQVLVQFFDTGFQSPFVLGVFPSKPDYEKMQHESYPDVIQNKTKSGYEYTLDEKNKYFHFKTPNGFELTLTDGNASIKGNNITIKNSNTSIDSSDVKITTSNVKIDSPIVETTGVIKCKMLEAETDVTAGPKKTSLVSHMHDVAALPNPTGAVIPTLPPK